METQSTINNGPAESLRQTLRSFPAAVWVLFAGVFLNKFGTFVVPFLTLYLTRQGFTTADAGFAVGAYGVGRALAGFLGGHMADTLGRRKTIVLSMIMAAITMLLLSQARTFPWIILLTGLASLTGELYLPACGALLADLVPPHRRVTAYAAYRMAFNAGWAFGPAAAAFLAAHSFLWLFVGDAMTSILFGAVAWFWLPRAVRGTNREASWTEAWSVMRCDRRFLQVSIAGVCIGLVFPQLVSTYGLHVTALGFSDAAYGALLSLNGALVVLFEMTVTVWTRRYAPRAMMALGYTLFGLGVALNAGFHGMGALILGMVIITAGEMAFAPVSGAYVAGLAPEGMRGRYMGAWGLTYSVPLMVAPSIGMMVFAHSPAAVWIGGGVLGLLAAAIVISEPRKLSRPAVGAAIVR